MRLPAKRKDHSPGSFKVNCETGAWADFATSDTGGDLTSLASFLFDLPQHEAADFLGSAVGLYEPETAIAVQFILIHTAP